MGRGTPPALCCRSFPATREEDTGGTPMATTAPGKGIVYLLHFVDGTGQTCRYKHAGHYLGTAEDFERRVHQHKAGSGARLMQVITNAGLDFVVARTWRGGREMERMLKGWHSGVKLCPICQQEKNK